MENNLYIHAVEHLSRFFDPESFRKYFINSKQNFPLLSLIIKECNVSDIRCRFNVWRLCLGVVSVDAAEEQKRLQLTEQRRKYQQKKEEALKSYNKKSPIKQPVKKNPLLMMGSPKPTDNKQIQSDEFLKQQIHKDVERTYQEMKFFQQKAIQKLLNLLLFVWCRRNPDVSYKQGMNELLASVVVCYFKEAEFRSIKDKPENISAQLWNSHIFFNSVEHAESDIYSVFQKIIDIQGDMYKTQADITIKSKVNPNSKNNTPILQRIMHIKDHKLKHMDLQLFRILKLQDVQTKSFMLRWIRCMHTRQFDLDNSFVIWDSIFLQFLESDNSKKNKQFEFIDAMCLAMFMYMRSIVFTKQTAGQILQVYQKYPVLKRGSYLDELITLAWTICEQLRIESQNSQASQSNWFEQSQKLKALHFMDKKTEKKPAQTIVEVKPKETPKKSQPVQKQLKQTQNKKQIQKPKKAPQPVIQKPAKESLSEGSTLGNLQQKQSSQKIAKQSSSQNHDLNIITHHKSTPVLEKEPVGHLTKNLSIEETVKHPSISSEHKPIKQEKHESTQIHKHPLPIPLSNKQSGSISSKVPDNISISLSSIQITEILQNLNESLPKIRDIDVQSFIRRTIKKLQSKVKQAKQKDEQQKGKKSTNDANVHPIQNGQSTHHK